MDKERPHYQIAHFALDKNRRWYYNLVMVKFSYRNHKLNELARWHEMPLNRVASFDLPAGWTCAKAGICKTLVARDTGKINQLGRVKCYAAKAECYAPNTRLMRWHNFDSLVECNGNISNMTALLWNSLSRNVEIVRIHSSGDFFSKNYFKAWVGMATMCPDVTFFGYTKHLDYATSDLPDNMFLQYSFGSRDDSRMLALDYHVPTCFIAETEYMYPEYKRVCAGENSSHEDFVAILNHETFVIGMH